MRFALLAAFLLIAVSMCVSQNTLAVLEVDPAEPTALAAQDHVSVRVSYTAQEDVLIWVRPSSGGAEVSKGSSHPSPKYSAGSGEAFGWFQIDKPLAIDAIRIQMVSAKGRRVLAQVDYPMALSFTGVAGSSRTRAAWSTQLNDAQQQRFLEQAAQSRTADNGIGGVLFGLAFGAIALVAFVATFAWPAYKAYQWKGLWRGAAVLPILAMAFVILRILVDTQRDPTSHNLWPFEILMFGAGSLCFMALLTVGYRLTRSERE